MFVLQYLQPGLAGLMDGSVSTLAPLFAAAFATRNSWDAFLVCFGALDNGRVAGYVWLAYAAARYTDQVWVRTDASSRYTYKVFVHPEHRGRGLAGELYRRADTAALARGRTRAVMVVQADNPASLRAARRDGFAIVGYAGHVSFRGG